jgi:hypothetical protein
LAIMLFAMKRSILPCGNFRFEKLELKFENLKLRFFALWQNHYHTPLAMFALIKMFTGLDILGDDDANTREGIETTIKEGSETNDDKEFTAKESAKFDETSGKEELQVEDLKTSTVKETLSDHETVVTVSQKKRSKALIQLTATNGGGTDDGERVTRLVPVTYARTSSPIIDELSAAEQIRNRRVRKVTKIAPMSNKSRTNPKIIPRGQ